MITSSNLTPGMTISIGNKLYRVESSVKVTVTKGKPFIKTKLRDLVTGKVSEKNFKTDQNVQEVSLVERTLEYLYPEQNNFLFLDIDNLEIVKVPSNVVVDKINYLKEGTEMTGSIYGDTVFAVELPQFLELMVAKTEGEDESETVSSDMKMAVLETGAKVEVPGFITVGDIIKVDTKTNEYVQRV